MSCHPSAGSPGYPSPDDVFGSVRAREPIRSSRHGSQVQLGGLERPCRRVAVGARRCFGAVDDGRRAFVVTLNSPDRALYMPRHVWGMQFGHSEGAALLVLASAPYDRAEYIEDYGEFLALAATPR